MLGKQTALFRSEKYGKPASSTESLSSLGAKYVGANKLHGQAVYRPMAMALGVLV